MTTSINKSRHAGFTLLEVMITVVIVGILAAVALPSYTDTILRGKIIDGTTKLGDFRAQMEKFFMDNRNYGPGPCGVPNPPVGGSDQFIITCVLGGLPFTYTATATGNPANGMPAAFIYTVDQANVKTSVGPAGWTPGPGCWAIRKDGSC